MYMNNQQIPEGWSVKKLGDIVSKISRRNIINNTNVVTISAQKGFIKQEQFFNKSVAGSDLTNYYLLEKGDFGYNRSYSKGYPLGAIKRVDNYDYATVSTLYICFRPLDKVNSDYLLQYFETGLQHFELYKIVQEGARNHGLLNVSLSDFFDIKLILPPLAEQEKIAEILGTWNEAIEKLSSLIVQKKLIKKGLMQKLLTGKVRLFKTSPLAGEVADLSASEGLDYNDNIKISSHRMYQPYIKEFSRDMRKNSTKAENLLWQKIRNGQLGFKFRRQHQIDNKYIADFVCLEKRLIIELDGGQHNDRPKDKDRTLYLENNNFKVIRFWDNEILQNIDGCLEILLKEISLLNNPSPCPSPAMGEGISATYSNSLPQRAMKDVEYSLDTPHLAQECHPLPQGARKDERFSQPWKEVKLGEITEFISGYSFDSRDFKENGVPLIRISNIKNDKISLDNDSVFLDLSFLQKYTNYCIKYGDLLLAMSGATTGKMGVNKSNIPMLLNQRVGIIRAKMSWQSFLNQYLMRFNYKILQMSYGGAQPNIGSNDIKRIKLYIPSDISEQQAIANVLSTADDEIDLLNKKLILFKEQKKGLMQQLLTGNIRVKVN